MVSKEKWDNIFKCVCWRCLYLGINYLEKYNDYRVDKVIDIDCVWWWNYLGYWRVVVECCFGCNE